MTSAFDSRRRNLVSSAQAAPLPLITPRGGPLHPFEAEMANFFAFTGRLLFAVLFLTSGVQKLINYDFKHGGGALTRLVETKMNTFNHSIKDVTGVELPLKTVRKFLSLHFKHPCQQKDLPFIKSKARLHVTKHFGIHTRSQSP